MKRLFAILMALVMVLSLGATAFAEESTGSITITNATKDDVYTLYKIFDASYSVGADGKAEGVSYTITTDNQFFAYMFGTDGKTVNTYFSYDAETGYVSRKADTQPSDIVAYLSEMVKGGSYTPASAPVTATGKTVVFDDLPYGYYIIDKGADSAVTITSNTPDVNVIDKNQIPGSDFSKLTWDEDKNEWVSNSSANIGDMVDFKVEFEATNYHGEKKIKYYTVADEKGDALWVEFASIKVEVGGVELKRGAYHGLAGTHATQEWDYFGDWTGYEKNADNAQWYLIHEGFDEFDIVIPWLEDHDFTGTTTGFDLAFADDADSVYASPVTVKITYQAAVEPGAVIGGGQHNNVWNEATLTWTSDTTDGPGEPSTTTSTVYALGLDKIDADADKHTHLAGAVFELYRDADCTKHVYVIPTGIDGVYIVDDYGIVVDDSKYESARTKYAAYVDAYLQGATQKNEVVSQVNGKLVVLGLEEGTYYLKETKAPDGYNVLANVETVSVGAQNSTNYTIICDANGDVYDKLEASDGQTKHIYKVSPVTVENSKGVVLPSTGGAGTMMLITFGTIIAMAFAVLLITHKKMSVYHD